MKLNYKRTFFIGFAFMSICAFWQMYDSVIPKILEGTFLMKETAVGVIMAADNVLALFMLPLFGAISDKANTSLGRRTPFIIIGTLCAGVAAILIPVAAEASSLIFFFVTLAIVLIAMSIYRSPAVALMPDLTPKPLRSKANAVINLMGTFGGIFTLVMISVLKPSVSGSYKPLFFAIVGFMFICITVLLITIRERKLAKKIGIYDVDENRSDASKTESKMDPAVKRSLVFLLISIVFWFFAYNAVSTAFSRYTTAVWGDTTDEYSKYLMSATITATLAFFPIGLLSSRLGRKKVILGGIVIMAASFFAGFFFHSVTVSAYFVFAFVGIGWAAINVNSYPMVVEMSRGSDVGKYTGIYYFFSMAAQIVTPIFSGFLIEKLSIGYRILFPYAAFFSAAAFVTMLFVRHGDSKPDAGSAAEAEEDA